MIMSTDVERVFDKIQQPFLIITLSKREVEGNFINLMKIVYENPAANIILNGEKMDAFPLSLESMQGWSFLTIPIIHCSSGLN